MRNVLLYSWLRILIKQYKLIIAIISITPTTAKIRHKTYKHKHEDNFFYDLAYICFLCRHIVNAFLLIYQIGTCCVYVVFVSENIQFVMTKQFGMDVAVTEVMLWILVPLILINWVRDLKYLAPFSAIANAVTIVSFGIILYYIFRVTPTLEGKVPAGKIGDFPLFFGTVLFALEAIGVVS